ncbi:MAG: family 78 glycoside hydrolase catalytic domain [Bacillota bacterium]
MASPNALYIWNDKAGTGRNRFVLFRRTFSLLGPKTGYLSIFADTRYRLIVNGHTIGRGPARFFVSHPEYDPYDLTPYLRTGRNVIAVLVNSYGCATFHSQPSIGSLIVWGQAQDKTGRTVKFNTDDSWRTIESPGHRPDTPCLSFALNPAEFLDAQAMPVGWEQADFDDREWPFATPIRRQDHWGPLQARSIPLLDERKILPRRRLGTWAARTDPQEQIYSLMVTTSTGRSLHTHARVALWTHIFSPRSQQITFGVWQGRYWINGQPVTPVERKDLHLRQDFPATLHEGWNTFLVYATMDFDWWDFYLALPRAAELQLSAERRLDSAHTFLIGGPWEDELAEEADRMTLPLAALSDLSDKLGGWKHWPRESTANTPCRERAWKQFEKLDEQTDLQVHVPAYATKVSQDTLCLLYDFGNEVLGRPVIDFEAAAGTVIDLTYSERLKLDGSSDLHARPSMDMAERYLARDGRQQWQTFHPRGFRYLEVLIHGDMNAFRLLEVALTRAIYPADSTATFECSDPTLNEIWQLGRQTLPACMEDAYLNCPGRERALYVGDLLVQSQVSRSCLGDTRLFRRCLELLLLAQDEKGLIPAAAHGLAAAQRPDCSALLPQAMWQYWAYTGDATLFKNHLPRLKRLMKGLESLRAEGADLLDGSHLPPCFDSGYMDKAGITCTLNCLCQRAFFDAARIMRLIGQPELGRVYSDRAQSLLQTIRREFWDDRRGVFVDRQCADGAKPQPSVAANALAILYDIADKDQSAQAVSWLIDALRNHFPHPVTPSLAFYVLGALYRQGKALEAEEFIRQHWGPMLDHGAWTCWEHLLDEEQASRCHARSAFPTHYLSTQVLGITFPEPGNLRRVLIRPQPGSLAWARGIYPHPDGPIRVSWQRTAHQIALDYEAPPSIEVLTQLPYAQPANHPNDWKSPTDAQR